MSKKYNIFISHSWNYSDSYNKLCEKLNERPYFFYNNHSVPSTNPILGARNDKQLEDAIYRKMYSCHVVLILGGVYSTYSKWINKEILIAKKFYTSKPIIGIKPYANTNWSSIVKNNADVCVNWNVEKIIKSIRNVSR